LEGGTSLDEKYLDLTSRMAHDIKNSIAVLKMLAFTLKDKLTIEENNILEEETDKIHKIIEDYRQKIK
jgi:hypothetical protein